MPIVLGIYLIASWYLGYIVVVRLGSKLPALLEWTAAFLLGTLITIPILYLSSCLFISTGQPMLFGTISTTIILIYLGIRYKKPIQMVFTFSDVCIVIFSILFSSWLMVKTFHGDGAGQLFVGSNNVFDFSHALGIIRSFSLGSNIPFMSPFQAGLPYFYHFFFNFYVALWEYFGIPIVWAMNIPSIVAFTSLLIVMYFLPQLVFKQTVRVGWIAVLLTLTNSTLTWWQILVQKGLSLQTLRSLWIVPTYPFAGPFDGSTISIFMTLNNYVNQRHLAFAIACSLFVVILLVKHIEQKEFTWKKALMYGILFGLLGMWNSAIAILAVLSVILLFFLKRLPKLGIVFAMASGAVLLLSYGQYLFLYKGLFVIGNAGLSIYANVVWNPIQYFFLNMGILPIIVLLGYFVISKKNKRYGLPFLLLGIMFCIMSVIKKVGFDQKFLSFLILWADVFAAIGVGWLWEKRTVIPKLGAVCLFVVLTASGVIDLIPIKNEFAYPLVDSKSLPVISWITTHTKKDAVFVSYSDMVDPVAFAGRKNYFGFFGNLGSYDRSSDVKNIYAGDINLANKLGVSYILVPKWNKSNFPYVADTIYFREHRRVAYEDERYIIIQVK